MCKLCDGRFYKFIFFWSSVYFGGYYELLLMAVFDGGVLKFIDGFEGG